MNIKRLRGMLMIAFAFVAIVCIGGNSIYAATSSVQLYDESTNIGTGGGGHSHSGTRIWLDGEPAACIEPTVAVHSGYTYSDAGAYEGDAGRAMSWLLKSSGLDWQIIQMAIWKLSGSSIETTDEYLAQVNTAIEQAYAAVAAASSSASVASISTGSYNMTYTKNFYSYGTVYVSDYVTISGSNGTSVDGGAFFIDANGGNCGSTVSDGTYRIVMYATSVSADMTLNVSASAKSGDATWTGNARKYTSPGSQTTVVAAQEEHAGTPASASFTIIAVGDLEIAKVDTHGNYIAGCKFLVTNSYGFSYECETGSDGKFLFDGTQTYNGQQVRVGQYTIVETYVPENLYIDPNDTTAYVTVSSGVTATYTKTNDYQRGRLYLSKEDVYEGKGPLRGDATLEKAVYEVYANEDIYEGKTLIFKKGELAYTLVTDSNGDVTQEDVPIGKYYIVELTPSTGFNLDTDTILYVSVTYTTMYKSLAATNLSYNADYTSSIVLEKITVKEDPILARVTVTKYDEDNNNNEELNNTEKSPATGAVLVLALKSSYDATTGTYGVYYEATIDENGDAEFIDYDFQAAHPDEECTIPYGDYVVFEKETSEYGGDYYLYIQQDEVFVEKDQEIYYRIYDDEPLDIRLKIVKVDSDASKTQKSNEEDVVSLAGFGFMIWDCSAGEFVEFMLDPSGEWVTELFTNDDGYLYTPQTIVAGEYIIYETTTPDVTNKYGAGYYLNESYRLPEDPDDYGDPTKGGLYVNICKTTTGVAEDEEYDQDENYIYTLEMTDEELTGKLTIYKTGETLTDVTGQTVETSFDGTQTDVLYTFVWNEKGLEGCTFEIYTAEEITSLTGLVHYDADEKIGELVTDEYGYATSDELYPGEYYLVEVSAPNGYILSSEKIPVTVVASGNELVKIEENDEVDIDNDRQHLSLTFQKVFEDLKYDLGYEQKALFGVYTEEDMLVGNGTLKADSLVELITVYGKDDGSGTVTADVTSTVDLPEGDYYVVELDVSEPYQILSEVQSFTLKYDGTNNPYVVVSAASELNTYPKASLAVLKLSASSLALSEEDYVEIDGEDTKISASLVELLQEEMESIIMDKGKDALLDFIKNNSGLIVIPGTEFTVYVDKDCTTTLKDEDGKDVVITTDEYGIAYLEDLPLGTYYLKETYVPGDYELSKETLTYTLTQEKKDKTGVLAVVDELVKTSVIEKTDIFTGEKVANCTFKITDEDDNVIVEMITDENGIAKLPIDIFENGKTYYYTEIDAPDIYKEDGVLYTLNTETHEFVASYEYDENGIPVWTGENTLEVENYRPTTSVTITKLDFADSTAIPNCEFELRSLETDYVVTGVTDENGIYVFEDVPYGEYTYTELSAPEEYNIDTEPHEITIDGETKIVVYNEKVDTGDIAVIALAILAIVCIAGISFVVIKNRKLNKA